MRKLTFLLFGFCCLVGLACTSNVDDTPSGGESITNEVVKTSHAPFPDEWFYYEADRPTSLRDMEGKPAPKLRVKDWLGEPLSLEQLQGQVVIVDFWGTWCGPCVAALPKNVAMFEKYADQGLAIIGVHDSRRGFEKMAEVAQSAGIKYPLCVDDDGSSTETWNVSFWPTYFLIDQDGVVRAAGLNPLSVETAAVELLGG